MKKVSTEKQFGFSLIGVLLIIGVLALIAGGVVVWRDLSFPHPTPTPTPVLPIPITPIPSPTMPAVVSPTPKTIGLCENLPQGECESSWECDPIYRTGSCQPTGPIMLPVEVYCGCKSLTAQEKQNRLRDKLLCEQTNGQWGIRNCLCLPQKDGVPLYTPEEGTHHFVSLRGCVSDKTFCLESGGRWTEGQLCQPGEIGCAGYGKTNPICTCPAGKNFRSGAGCL